MPQPWKCGFDAADDNVSDLCECALIVSELLAHVENKLELPERFTTRQNEPALTQVG